MLEDTPTTGSIETSASMKRALAVQSHAFNLKDPVFLGTPGGPPLGHRLGRRGPYRRPRARAPDYRWACCDAELFPEVADAIRSGKIALPQTTPVLPPQADQKAALRARATWAPRRRCRWRACRASRCSCWPPRRWWPPTLQWAWSACGEPWAASWHSPCAVYSECVCVKPRAMYPCTIRWRFEKCHESSLFILRALVHTR